MIAGQKYQCCVCATAVEPVAPDVAGLVYWSCADRPEGFQRDQQFFCHTKRLIDRSHSTAKLYVIDLCQAQSRDQVGL